MEPFQELPARLLTDDDIDDERVRLQRLDQGEGVRHVVGGGDVVAFPLEQLAHNVQKGRGAVDGEDVFAPLLVTILHRLPPCRTDSDARMLTRLVLPGPRDGVAALPRTR